MKLIVSIQGFTRETNKELCNIVLNNGATLVRTDKDINNKSKTIGLSKKGKGKHYITQSIQEIDEISEWAKYIAIDCRKQNKNTKKLLQYCDSKDINVIADIEKADDIKSIVNYFPLSFVATTFCYDKLNKLEILKEIIDTAKQYNITVIAEGGYCEKFEIDSAQKLGADFVCVGEAISKTDLLTKKFVGMIQENKINKTLLVDIDDTLLLYKDNSSFQYLKAFPNYDEIDRLNKLYNSGYEIILFTSRDYSKYDFTVKQMNKFKIKFHKLIMNKPHGIYVDKDSIKTLKELK